MRRHLALIVQGVGHEALKKLFSKKCVLILIFVRVLLVLDEWTPDNGLVTAAFKIRRFDTSQSVPSLTP